MILGIVLAAAGVAGVVLGIVKKIKALIIASAVVLVLVAGVWIFFYNNPY
jgi:hypothetical protein